jgi:DNA-binding transcriptional MerR regulator
MRMESVRLQPADPAASEDVQPPFEADADQPVFAIGQLAHEFGVTLRTLRFYEARGFLSPRREGTVRLYSQCDHDRLGLILKTKKLGFTLREIAELIGDDGESRQQDLPLSRRQCVEQINLLERQKSAIEHALAELRQTYSSHYLRNLDQGKFAGD